MIARRASALALLVAIAAVIVVVLSSGSNSYAIKMQLADADGLRQNSPVAIGGQDVGTISMSVRHGRVLVTMNIDHANAPLGRDATASVTSVNLLGQKRIELVKGNVSTPAPSGYMLPASQVNVTTDLDQVLNVLTPDVRARLAILVNEAGQAFTGRRADFSQMLAQLPGDFSAGAQLLNGISSDNHMLANLVQTSDGFVTQLATQRTALVVMLHAFGQASATVQTKRAQLAATLAKAPGTLATLQTFLVKLQRTTVPLAPAARAITATVPAINTTLAQLDPFRLAADPTLTQATVVAPALTRLATGATPVIRQATPVVGQLATFSSALAPVSDIANHSVDNIVAILQNWSRAIQFRDGLSHVFRGEASFTPQTLTAMITQLQQAGVLGSLNKAAQQIRVARMHKTPSHQSAAAPAATPAPGSTPTGTTTGTTGTGTSTTTTTPASTTPTTPTPTTPNSGPTGGLGALLSFLFKR
jgi:phospholipid/cholesterol/gamma-HCH transport system substrate-binding protein